MRNVLCADIDNAAAEPRVTGRMLGRGRGAVWDGRGRAPRRRGPGSGVSASPQGCRSGVNRREGGRATSVFQGEGRRVLRWPWAVTCRPVPPAPLPWRVSQLYSLICHSA